ncbi:MAG: DUF2726 domain-containing protein [Planctomycetota bacterium]
MPALSTVLDNIVELAQLAAVFVAVAAAVILKKALDRRDASDAARPPARSPKTDKEITPAPPPTQAAGTLTDASATAETFHEYEARPTILTDPEQVLFRRLVEALPDLSVLAQVQLSQAIRPSLTFERQAALNRINRKSLDYLIVDQATAPVVAIELDDATHRRPDRQKADEVKTRALAAAGIQLLRYHVRSIPTHDELAADVERAHALLRLHGRE